MSLRHDPYKSPTTPFTDADKAEANKSIPLLSESPHDCAAWHDAIVLCKRRMLRDLSKTNGMLSGIMAAPPEHLLGMLLIEAIGNLAASVDGVGSEIDELASRVCKTIATSGR